MDDDSTETWLDVVFSRHKRSTNSTATSSSSSEEDLFSENNKLAMYVVIPVMFLVYGGCACIYCCYKCRQYVKNNNPIQQIKTYFSKTKHTDKTASVDENEDNESCNENTLDEVAPRRNNDSHSATSSPGPDTVLSYVDFEDDTAMSTPGFGYPVRKDICKRGSWKEHSNITHHKHIEMTSVPHMRTGSDSGIEGDSNLTELSENVSNTRKFEKSVPISQSNKNAITVAAHESYSAKKSDLEESPGFIAPLKRRETSEIAIQTDAVIVLDSKNEKSTEGMETRRKVKPRIVPKYLDHFKTNVNKSEVSTTYSKNGEPNIHTTGGGGSKVDSGKKNALPIDGRTDELKISTPKCDDTTVDLGKQGGQLNVKENQELKKDMLHPGNIQATRSSTSIAGSDSTKRSSLKPKPSVATKKTPTFDPDDPRSYIVKPWS